MKLSVIITAGGIGKRFSSTIPKQFLNLDELPILMHTIKRFSNWKPEVKIILTLPKEWREYWDGLIEKHDLLFRIKLLMEEEKGSIQLKTH